MKTQSALPKNIVLPSGMQYMPLDKTVKKIVEELVQHDFNALELKVEFGQLADGSNVVRSIENEDILLKFGRTGSYPKLRPTDLSGPLKSPNLAVVSIRGQQLALFDDETGPIYYHFVGDSWILQRHDFKHSKKENAALRGEPRIYLEYRGSCFQDKIRVKSGERSPFLLPYSDSGRQHTITFGDPKLFRTDKVIEAIDYSLVLQLLNPLLELNRSRLK